MALTQEEFESRIREALTPLQGQRITKENLTQVLQSVTTQIYREFPPPDRPHEDISIDENGKVTIPLDPFLSKLLREKLKEESEEPRWEVTIRLGPDGEILYNPPVSDND
jgi:hypothetical protein